MDLHLTSTLVLFLTTLAAVAAFMLVAWLLSLMRRDVSIVDAFWGPGFALVALVALVSTEGFDGRRWLLLTLASPILMSIFLMKVSGVPLLEGKLAETRPGYREYVERTNAFFPGPPG